MTEEPETHPEAGQHILSWYEDVLGMTQVQFCRHSNISDVTLRRIERGEIEAREKRTLRKLVAALYWPPNAIERLLAGEVPDATWDERATSERPLAPSVVEPTNADLKESIDQLAGRIEAMVDALIQERQSDGRSPS